MLYKHSEVIVNRSFLLYRKRRFFVIQLHSSYDFLVHLHSSLLLYNYSEVVSVVQVHNSLFVLYKCTEVAQLPKKFFLLYKYTALVVTLNNIFVCASLHKSSFLLYNDTAVVFFANVHRSCLCCTSAHKLFLYKYA